MKINVTTKGFKVSPETSKHLSSHFQKISRQLPHMKTDLPFLTLLMKKSKNKYYAKKHYHPAFSDNSNRHQTLANYVGSLSLRLPKSVLFVKFSGRSVNELISNGLGRLKKEFHRYKDLHFKSQSRYPNRLSLRKINFYE